MSNVLTKEIRSHIVSAALDAKFLDRIEAFQVSKTQLADALYAILVPPEEEARVRALGQRWYELSDRLYIDCDGFHNRGEGPGGSDYRWEMVDARIQMSSERPMPIIQRSEELKIDEGHLLWPLTRLIVAERAAILAERALLREQLQTIVYAANTRNRLLELWPEGEKFMPPLLSRSRSLVPIDTVKAVNAALDLP